MRQCSFSPDLHHHFERRTRLLPSLLAPPYSSVGMLHPDQQIALRVRNVTLDELAVLVRSERLAMQGDWGVTSALSDIHWRTNNTVRLLLYTVRREIHLPHLGPDTLHFLHSLHTHLYDEKAPEDIHQHIRDNQRTRRHTHTQSTIHHPQHPNPQWYSGRQAVAVPHTKHEEYSCRELDMSQVPIAIHPTQHICTTRLASHIRYDLGHVDIFS